MRVSAVAQWVNDLACPCGNAGSISGPVQWVKDLALLQLWPQLWLGFNLWPRNFHMLQGWPKKKKKKIGNACGMQKSWARDQTHATAVTTPDS